MSNPQKKHVCTHTDCNQSFSRPYRLNQHLLTHNNVKAYACKEVDCTKSYTSKSHLDRHIRSAHKCGDKNVVYSCPNCLKTYSNRQNLKRHIKVHHLTKNSKPFTCDDCKQQFKKKNQLSAHMYEHTGVKSFSCNLCDKDFITLYDKKRHMRCHKTYTCDICLAIFNHWSKYHKHKKAAHDIKEFICDECGRKFKQRVHIVRHVKDHSGGVMAKVFKCPYERCKRMYTRSTFLRHHIITKHEKYKLTCTICEEGFVTLAKLNEHTKLHNLPNHKPTNNKARQARKDKGNMKISTALKLAGLPILCDKDENDFHSNLNGSLQQYGEERTLALPNLGSLETCLEEGLSATVLLPQEQCKENNSSINSI